MQLENKMKITMKSQLQFLSCSHGGVFICAFLAVRFDTKTTFTDRNSNTSILLYQVANVCTRSIHKPKYMALQIRHFYFFLNTAWKKAPDTRALKRLLIFRMKLICQTSLSNAHILATIILFLLKYICCKL